MAKQWSKEEEAPLLEQIASYRLEIHQKDIKVAKKITIRFAENIHQQNPFLRHRKINAINERLPYLENLLAGVFQKHHYAIKDQHMYATLPREDKSKIPNLCNTRHKYNGAMVDYLSKNNNRSE